jgi:arsenate reductase
MTVTLWGYSKCGTCRNAQKWLKEHGVTATWVEITDSPPDVETLRQMVAHSGLSLAKFFNTSGELYRELNIKDKLPSLSEQDQLALLAAHGKLIKRPLCSDGTRVTVGFKPEQYVEIWGATNGT